MKIARIALGFWFLLAGPAFAEAKQYGFAPDSQVSFTVRHPMHQAAGKTSDVRGILKVPSLEHPQQAEIQVAIPILSFDTHNANRDQHMFEVLHASRYPGVIFKSRSVTVEKVVKTEKGRVLSGEIAGDLLFHGKTRAIQAPITLVLEREPVSAETAFKFRLTDFDVARPSFMMVPMEDEVAVAVNLRFIPALEKPSTTATKR